MIDGLITKAPPPKPVHRGAHMTDDGRVSALCFDRPRAINLKVASWTIVDRQVTCKKCKQKMTK